MNQFKKNDRKEISSYDKKINPQQENQVNSHNENHANSKPVGMDKIDKDATNPLKSEQASQGNKQ